MEKGINDKLNALRDVAGNQEEFMKKLAELDEQGELTEEVLNRVNGGTAWPTLPKWLGFFLE